MVFTGVFFDTNYFNSDYKKLVNKNYGEKFIIDKTCVRNEVNKSKELKFILENSYKIKDLKFLKNNYELRNFF